MFSSVIAITTIDINNDIIITIFMNIIIIYEYYEFPFLIIIMSIFIIIINGTITNNTSDINVITIIGVDNSNNE